MTVRHSTPNDQSVTPLKAPLTRPTSREHADTSRAGPLILVRVDLTHQMRCAIR